MDIPIFFIAAFVATFFYAIDGVSSKIILNYIKNPIILLIYQFCINLVVVSIVFIFLFNTGTDFSTVFYPNNLLILITSSLLIFAGVLAIYYGLNVGDVSVASVVLSGRVLFVIPIGLLFLKENYSEITYFWITFLVLGIILVSWERNYSIKEIFLFKGTYYYLLANILMAIANSLIRFLQNEVHFIAIILIRFIVFTPLIMLCGHYLIEKFNYPQVLKKYDFKFTIIIFFQVLCTFFADIGYVYSLGESVTITEAIGTLQTLFVFILVFFLSKFQIFQLNEFVDKKTTILRIIGMTLALLGTIGIALQY